MKCSNVLLLVLVCFALCACAGLEPVDGAQGRGTTSSVALGLERAALEAEQAGDIGQALVFRERLYERDPENPLNALSYARLLREAEHLNRALIVLSPFVQMDGVPAGVFREFAMIQLAMGRYQEADRFARRAIAQESQDFRAYHVLGISLDARGLHKEAETVFRKSLEHWEGDPVPVMNNLALNLVSQGYLDEAMDILRRALVLAPDRSDVERNLRIVSRLQANQFTRVRPNASDSSDSSVLPPVPPRKPVLAGSGSGQ